MGELARKPGCPTLAETPLELLTPRPGDGFSTTDRYLWPTLGIITGVGSVILANILGRRPAWAGIHLHVAFGGLAWYLSSLARDSYFAAKSESDAVLRHYISLHPDDFPPFDRKRWKDVYVPFQPIR